LSAERPWIQFEVKSMNGSEPWLLIRHRRGTFKLPQTCALSELLTGVREGWTSSSRRTASGTLVRVDVGEWRLFQEWKVRTYGYGGGAAGLDGSRGTPSTEG